MNINQLKDYVEKNHKTHLVFDFDGTLVTLKFDVEKVREELGNTYLEIDKNLGYKKGEKTTPWTNRYIKVHGDLAREKISKTIEKCENNFVEQIDDNEDLIKFISDSTLNLYMWTNNTRGLVEKILARYGILNKFKILATRNEAQFIKPDPSGFSLIYDNRVELKSYLLIGNSVEDEGAAINSGIDFFMIEHNWKV